ncbi:MULTISPECIES: zinc-ribbon domain-containing protein [unclassified Saccharicrinis]|uniref:zinc-ribbon domain-containing protein n=1 Tax=unclassified Saccharicrinis TaxID=2646859 RepID=UPI003D35180A
MLIYGWRSSHIKTLPSKNITCPNCNEKGGIVNSYYGRYFHLFWIPTFSLGKKGASQCSKCNHIFEPKHMSENIERQYKEMKCEVKLPLWHFSGLIIIVLIAVIMTY